MAASAGQRSSLVSRVEADVSEEGMAEEEEVELSASEWTVVLAGVGTAGVG